jgi:hypothetical protein
MLISAIALVGWACSGGETTEEPSGPNTLTTAERDAGWQLLFDGETTAGWRAYNQDAFPEQGWEVQDGNLVVLAEGGGGDIITDEAFENFELSLEFKVSPGANSGIFYSVQELPDEAIWHSAPEYQLLDDVAFTEGGQDMSTHLTGDNYHLHASSERVVRAVGEWNVAKIVLDGAHVEHWLNGAKLVEYERWSPEWNELVAASKFSAYPEYGQARSGHIGLQDHGYLMEFRNIKIRPITP